MKSTNLLPLQGFVVVDIPNKYDFDKAIFSVNTGSSTCGCGSSQTAPEEVLTVCCPYGRFFYLQFPDGLRANQRFSFNVSGLVNQVGEGDATFQVRTSNDMWRFVDGGFDSVSISAPHLEEPGIKVVARHLFVFAADGTPIEQPSPFSGFQAGMTAWVNVSFRTTNFLGKNGYFNIGFADGFNVDDAMVVGVTGINGTVGGSFRDKEARVILTNGATVPAGSLVSIQIAYVKTPTEGQGTQTAVTLQSRTFTNDVIDESVGVSPSTLLPGVLRYARVQILPSESSPTAAPGSVTAMNFSFVLSSTLNSEGAISVLLPVGFNVSTADVSTVCWGQAQNFLYAKISNPCLLNPPNSMYVAGTGEQLVKDSVGGTAHNQITLKRPGVGPDLVQGDHVWFVLSGIMVPNIASADPISARIATVNSSACIVCELENVQVTATALLLSSQALADATMSMASLPAYVSNLTVVAIQQTTCASGIALQYMKLQPGTLWFSVGPMTGATNIECADVSVLGTEIEVTLTNNAGSFAGKAFVTPPSPPSAPQNLVISQTGHLSVGIVWEKPADGGVQSGEGFFQTYEIQFSLSDTFTAPDTVSSMCCSSWKSCCNIRQLAYANTALTLSGRRIYSRLRASNQQAISSFSSTVDIIVIGPPDAPLLTVNPALPSGGEAEVVVSWTAPADTGLGAEDVSTASQDELVAADLLYYEWELSATSSAGTPMRQRLPLNVTNQTLLLDVGDQYLVRVRAINSFGPGDWASSQFRASGLPLEATVSNAEAVAPQTIGITLDVSDSGFGSADLEILEVLVEQVEVPPELFLACCKSDPSHECMDSIFPQPTPAMNLSTNFSDANMTSMMNMTNVTSVTLSDAFIYTSFSVTPPLLQIDLSQSPDLQVLSFQIGSLVRGAAYRFRVQIRNKVGWSLWSDYSGAVQAQGLPLPIPFFAIPPELTPGSARLTASTTVFSWLQDFAYRFTVRSNPQYPILGATDAPPNTMSLTPNGTVSRNSDALQHVRTQGAVDVEYLEAADGSSYLIYANTETFFGTSVESTTVYKYDPATGLFGGSCGYNFATDIADDTGQPCTNYKKPLGASRANLEEPSLNLHQLIFSFGVVKIKSFTVDGMSYLLVVNSKSPVRFQCTNPDTGAPIRYPRAAQGSNYWPTSSIDVTDVQCSGWNANCYNVPFDRGSLTFVNGTCLPDDSGSTTDPTNAASVVYVLSATDSLFHYVQSVILPNPVDAVTFSTPDVCTPVSPGDTCLQTSSQCTCTQQTFVAMASSDGYCNVYQYSTGSLQFKQQLLHTELSSVAFVRTNNESVLVLAGGADAEIFRLDNGMFVPFSTAPIGQASSLLAVYPTEKPQLVVSVQGDSSQVYEWNNGSFDFRQELSTTDTESVTSFSVPGTAATRDYIILSRSDLPSVLMEWKTTYSATGLLLFDGYAAVRNVYAYGAKAARVFTSSGKTMAAFATDSFYEGSATPNGDGVFFADCDSTSCADATSATSINPSCDVRAAGQCCEKAGDACEVRAAVADGSLHVVPFDAAAHNDKEFEPFPIDGTPAGVTARHLAKYSPIFTLPAWPSYDTLHYSGCKNSDVIPLKQTEEGEPDWEYLGASELVTVHTWNVLGESSESQAFFVRTLHLPTAPTMNPMQVSGPQILLISWDPPALDGEVNSGRRPSVITNYILVIWSAACDDPNKVVLSNLKLGNVTEYSLSNRRLVAGQLVCAQVSAVNMVGTGNASVMQDGQVLAVPGAVVDPEVNILLGPRHICISWSPPTNVGLGGITILPSQFDALQYFLLVSDSADQSNATGNDYLISAGSPDTLQLGLGPSALADQADYWFVLYASNEAGVGAATILQTCAISRPSPPTNISVDIVGDLAILVRWNVVPTPTNCPQDAPTGFLIEVSENTFFAPPKQINGSSTTFVGQAFLSAVIGTDLAKNGVYYFRVLTENFAGSSLPSSFVSARAAAPPSAPPSVNTSVVNHLATQLVFDMPDDTGYGDSSFPVIGFRVQASSSPSFLPSEIIHDSGRVLGSYGYYEAQGLPVGVFAYFRVNAINKAGQGDWSDPVIERVIGTPSSPLNLHVAVSGDLELGVTWTIPLDTGVGNGVDYLVNTYVVEISANQEFTNSTEIEVTASSSASVVGSAEPVDIVYTDQGEEVSRVPIIDAFNPCSCVTLCSPTVVDGPLMCNVLNSAMCGVAARPCATVNTATEQNLLVQSAFLDSEGGGSLIKGQTYFVRIFAANLVGRGAASATSLNRAVQVPSPPHDLGAATDVSGILLSWTPPVDSGIGGLAQPLLSYEIQYDVENFTSCCAYLSTVVDEDQVSHVMSDTLFESGLTYFFRIVARNVAGSSRPARVVSEIFTGKPSPPDAVVVSFVADGTLAKAIVTWDRPVDDGLGTLSSGVIPLRYELQTSRSQDFYTFETLITGVEVQTATLPGLLQGTDYYFRVAARNLAGLGQESAPIRSAYAKNPTVLAILPSPAVSSLTTHTLRVVIADFPGSPLGATNCSAVFGDLGAARVLDCFTDFMPGPGPPGTLVRSKVTYVLQTPPVHAGFGGVVMVDTFFLGSRVNASFAVTFLPSAVPAITSVYPAVVRTSGEKVVLVSVVNFPKVQGPLDVKVSSPSLGVDNLAVSLNSWSSALTQLYVTVPEVRSSTSTAMLNVMHVGSGVSLTMQLRFSNGAFVQGLSPAFGSTAGGYSVGIKLQGMGMVRSVSFAGTTVMCPEFDVDMAVCMVPVMMPNQTVAPIIVSGTGGTARANFTLIPEMQEFLVSSFERVGDMDDAGTLKVFMPEGGSTTVYESETVSVVFEVQAPSAWLLFAGSLELHLAIAAGPFRGVSTPVSDVSIVFIGDTSVRAVASISGSVFVSGANNAIVKLGQNIGTRERAFVVLPGQRCDLTVSPPSARVGDLPRVAISLPAWLDSAMVIIGVTAIDAAGLELLRKEGRTEVAFSLPSGIEVGTEIGRLSGSYQGSPLLCSFAWDTVNAPLGEASVTFVSTSSGPVSGGTVVVLSVTALPFFASPGDVVVRVGLTGTTFTAKEARWTESSSEIELEMPPARTGLSKLFISTAGSGAASPFFLFQFTSDVTASLVLAEPRRVFDSTATPMAIEVKGFEGVTQPFHVRVTLNSISTPVDEIMVRADGTVRLHFKTPDNLTPGDGIVIVTKTIGIQLEVAALVTVAPRPSGRARILQMSPMEGPLTGFNVSVTMENLNLYITSPADVAAAAVVVDLAAPVPVQVLAVVSSALSTILTLAIPPVPFSASATLRVWTCDSGNGVCDMGQAASASFKFKYKDPRQAVVVKHSPTRGSALGGTLVTIEVRDLTPVAAAEDVQVRVGSEVSGSVQVETIGRSTFVQFYTLPKPAGTYMLQLTPKGFGDVDLAPQFSFEYLDIQAHTVEWVVPGNVLIGGGTPVSLLVSNLAAGLVASDLIVTVGAVPASVLQVSQSGALAEIRVIAPPQDTSGVYAITLSTPSGAMSESNLTYVSPPMPKLLQISPQEGPASGGWPLLLKVSGFVSTQPESMSQIGIRIGGVSCPVLDVVPSGGAASMMFIVSTTAPPLPAGTQDVVVFEENEDGAVAMASGLVQVDEKMSLIITDVWPLEFDAAAATIITVTLRDLAPSVRLSDVDVMLDGEFCKVTDLVWHSTTESVVVLETRPNSRKGKTIIGTIATRGEMAAKATFEMRRVGLGPRIISASPSQGSVYGGTFVRIVIADLLGPEMPAEAIQVRFGGILAQIEHVFSASSADADIGVRTPAYTLLDSSEVEVTVSLVQFEDQAATFTFMYTTSPPTVVSVSPPKVVPGRPEVMTVVVESMPVLRSSSEVSLVIAGELVSVDLAYADDSRTSFTFTVPSSLPAGTVHGFFIPAFFLDVSIPFSIEIMDSVKPALVSVSPSMGPAGTPFYVDVLIDRYPVRPLGSFDADFQDISGPVKPLVQPADVASFVAASVVRGGYYTMNSTSQLRFIVQSDPGANAVSFSIMVDTDMYSMTPVSVTLELYDRSNPTILSVEPSQGTTLSGSTIMISVANFVVEDTENIVASVRGTSLMVQDFIATEHVVRFSLMVPSGMPSGAHVISVAADAASTARLSFPFFVWDACNYDTFCYVQGKTVDRSAVAMLPFSEPEQQCQSWVCTDPRTLVRPVVELVKPSVGEVAGGTLVEMWVSGLSELDPQHLLLVFGEETSSIESLEAVSAGLVKLTTKAPSSLAVGSVPGKLLVIGSAGQPALFTFTYHRTYELEPSVGAVSPGQCILGSNSTMISVSIANWPPIADRERVFVQQGSTQVDVLVQRSDWTQTLLTFEAVCIKEGVSTAFVVRPSYKDPLPFMISGETKSSKVLSLFPSHGDISGGTAVVVRIQDLLAINGTLTARPMDASLFVDPTMQFRVDSVQLLDTDTNVTTVVITTPRAQSPGPVSFMIGMAQVSFHYYDGRTPFIESVSTDTSTTQGGTEVVLSIIGFPALPNNQASDLVVAFGPRQATVQRILLASQPGFATRFQFVTPAFPRAAELDILVYRAVDAIGSAVSYKHDITAPAMQLTPPAGVITGGLAVVFTVYEFDGLQAPQSLRVSFGGFSARLMPGSITISNSTARPSTLKAVIPPSAMTGEVAVTLLSELTGQSQTATFTYVQKVQISSASPSIGPMAGGNIVTLTIDNFPVITSIEQALVRFGDAEASVRSLIASDSIRTVLQVIAPRGFAGPGKVSLSVSPRFEAVKELQRELTAFTSYTVRRRLATVASLHPSEVPAMQGTDVAIRIDGLTQIDDVRRVQIWIGSSVATVKSVVFSDELASHLVVQVPPLPAGRHAGAVEHASDFASFHLLVLESGISASDVSPMQGSYTGGTQVHMWIAGLPVPLQSSDVSVRFGDTAAKVLAARASEGMTSVTVESPPFRASPGATDSSVPVYISTRQEPGKRVRVFQYMYEVPFQVQSATLNKEGTVLELKLDQPPTSPLTVEDDVVDMLGSNFSYGYFDDTPTVKVVLGPGATILPGTAGNIMHAPFTVVGSPTSSSDITGRLVGPSLVGPCEAVTLSAVVISTRPMSSYTWSVKSDLPGQGLLDERVVREVGSSLILGPEDFPIAFQTYTLQVTVRNFLGQQATFTHQLQRSVWPVPSLVALGPERAFSGQAFDLEAIATQSSCLDAAAFRPGPSNMIYRWTQMTPSRHVLGIEGPRVVIPPQPYSQAPLQFLLEAYSESAPTSIASHTLQVTLEPPPVLAVIENANRAVASDAVLVLDASLSEDEEYLMATLAYTWMCFVNNEPCRTRGGMLLRLPITATVELRMSVLPANVVYEFTLQVESWYGRVAQASAQVKSVSGPVRDIRIAKSPATRMLPVPHNANEVLRLLASPTSGGPFTWSVGELRNAASIVGPAATTMVLPANTVVLPSTLRLGVSSNAAGAAAEAWLQVDFNIPPSGGQCSLWPLQGTALATQFRVSCFGFDSRNKPLRFSVGVPASGAVVQLAPSYLYNQTLVLAAGRQFVYVDVVDRSGASSRVSTNAVQVTDDPSVDVAGVLRDALSLAHEQEVHSVIVALSGTALSGSRDEITRTALSAMEQVRDKAPDTPASSVRALQALSTVLQSDMSINAANLERAARFAQSKVAALGLSTTGIDLETLEQCFGVLDSLLAGMDRLRSAVALTYEQDLLISSVVEILADTAGKAALKPIVLGEFGYEIELDNLLAHGFSRVLSGLVDRSFSMPTTITPYGDLVSVRLPGAILADPMLNYGAEATVDIQMLQSERPWVQGAQQLLSKPFTLSISASTQDKVQPVLLGEEYLITLPFDGTSLPIDEQQSLWDGDSLVCLVYTGSSSLPWTTDWCRVQAVRASVDAAGDPVLGHGSVVCACTHLSTVAVGYGIPDVRLVGPSPGYGDLFIIKVGHEMNVPMTVVAPASTISSLMVNVSVMPGASTDPTVTMTPGGDSVNAVLNWRPMESGMYDVMVTFESLGFVLASRRLRVRVLFCEHFLTRGETLHEVAKDYNTTWQSLFVLNPSIESPHKLVEDTSGLFGRIWICQRGTCSVKSAERGPIAGLVVQIGMKVRTEQDETVPDVVRKLGGTLHQTIGENMQSLAVVSERPLVVDLLHPIHLIELCVVSSLSEECPL